MKKYLILLTTMLVLLGGVAYTSQHPVDLQGSTKARLEEQMREDLKKHHILTEVGTYATGKSILDRVGMYDYITYDLEGQTLLDGKVYQLILVDYSDEIATFKALEVEK